MNANDGRYKPRDGHEWQTILTVRDNLVEQVDGPWREGLEGRTLESVREYAEQHKLILEAE